jgi:FkbM family methyltransferase
VSVITWLKEDWKSNMMISFAQNYEDVVLERLFSGRQTGFYIDVGAWHPVWNSTTKHFYQKGWRGINIEPQPSFFELLQKDRPRDVNINATIGSSHASIDLITFPQKPASATTIKALAAEYEAAGIAIQHHQVRQTPLEEILTKHAHHTPIDFIKIDVEGSERAVLASFDLAKWQPIVMIIEATKPHTQEKTMNLWQDITKKAGYTCALFDGLNCYLAKNPTVIERLSAPVNVFDRPFIPEKLWQVLQPEARDLLQKEYLMYPAPVAEAHA